MTVLPLRTALALSFAAVACAQQPGIEFNREVRPILSDKCFGCHGPDAATRKIKLRLDSEAAASAALVPSDPDKSLLVRRITAESPGMRMPPAASGLRLSQQEIETLRQWVAQGARWQKHWSFVPPRRPAGNGIDDFVMDRLRREGLKPSPEANRTTLIRRVSLDLTGLPPAPSK